MSLRRATRPVMAKARSRRGHSLGIGDLSVRSAAHCRRPPASPHVPSGRHQQPVSVYSAQGGRRLIVHVDSRGVAGTPAPFGTLPPRPTLPPPPSTCRRPAYALLVGVRSTRCLARRASLRRTPTNRQEPLIGVFNAIAEPHGHVCRYGAWRPHRPLAGADRLDQPGPHAAAIRLNRPAYANEAPEVRFVANVVAYDDREIARFASQLHAHLDAQI